LKSLKFNAIGLKIDVTHLVINIQKEIESNKYFFKISRPK
jgi:hypothetical protein